MDRAEDEHPGHRGADADLGGLLVADLADHDDVGVLAEQRLQPLGEADVDPVVDLHLVDAREPVLDRVLDRHDVPRRDVHPAQAAIERRRLARPDGPGDEDGAVRLVAERAELLGLGAREAELVEAERLVERLVDPDDDLLAQDRRRRGDPEVARTRPCSGS